MGWPACECEASGEGVVRVKPAPWRGQLPPPRVSPPRTLGDALEVARRSKSPPRRSGSRHSSSPVLLAGATSSSDSGSCVIPKLPSVVGFGNTGGVPRITLGNSKSNLEPSLGRDLVCIGPGKWYRPVKGLIDLFSRTGTRIRHPNSSRQSYTRPSRSYADVVRSFRPPAMAGRGGHPPGAQPALNQNQQPHHAPPTNHQQAMYSQGYHGGQSQHFNPGLNPGFNPEYGGGGFQYGGGGRG
jgi:hypothetical protein